MTRDAIDALRSLLDEAREALRNGELADLAGSGHDVTERIERTQREAIGATPEQVARMADELGRALREARAALSTLGVRTRERLTEILLRSRDQPSAPSPALAAALRRARHDAIAALAAPRGQKSLKEMERLRSELESRSVAAAPGRTTGPETLPAWIATVAALLEQAQSGHVPCSASWQASLDAARTIGPAAPARAHAEAAQSLAAAAIELEARLLKREAAARAARETPRTAAIDLLGGADLDCEARSFLEAALGVEPAAAQGPRGDEELPVAIAKLRQSIEDRRESARARLQAALAAAEERGLPPSELLPSAEPAIGELQGPARWLAGAARIESLLADHGFRALRERAVAAVGRAWSEWLALPPGPGRDALRAALSDLKFRLAGEGPESVREALEGLDRRLPPSPRREAAPRPIPSLSEEDLSALEVAHPVAARTAKDLLDPANAPGAAVEIELIDQAALEARTLRQARGPVRH